MEKNCHPLCHSGRRAPNPFIRDDSEEVKGILDVANYLMPRANTGYPSETYLHIKHERLGKNILVAPAGFEPALPD